jgi:hypothetical protein
LGPFGDDRAGRIVALEQERQQLREALAVEQQNIQTRPVFKDPLPDLLTRMKHQSILKAVGIRGDEVRERLLVGEV